MSKAPQSDNYTPKITQRLAEFVTRLQFEDLSNAAIEVSKHCLLDWIGVTIAGVDEEVTQLLIAQSNADGGHKQASIVGKGRKVSTSQAVLINGTASHALDYDDVQTRLQGHPTVTVAPVVLALGEIGGATGKELLTAFAAGVDVECRLSLIHI